MIKSIQFAALFFLSILSLKAFASNDCDSESNLSAIQSCAEGQLTAHLETVYKDTLAFVSQDNPKAAELLQQAQAAWLDYAVKSCEFTVASRLPDSNSLYYGCWRKFTKEREKVLRAYKHDHGKVPSDLFNP